MTEETTATKLNRALRSADQVTRDFNRARLGGWVFLKADGMKRVIKFHTYDSAYRYVRKNVIGRNAKWPSKTILLGTGFPESRIGAKNPDFHARMVEIDSRDACIWLAIRACGEA